MKRTIVVVACFTVIVVLLYGVFSLALFETSAKYTDYKELNHFFESKEMYISSENLSTQDNKYNIINYYNFTNISLDITNSTNKNQITNYDITYTIECNVLNNQQSEYKCSIDSSGNNTVSSTLISNKVCQEDETLTEEECLNSKYAYQLVKTINNHQFKIINNGGNKEKLEVELILKTTSPYQKTLKSTYILNIGSEENNGISVNEVKDYHSFCEYNISNNYYINKNIKITINPNKLIFDTASDIYTDKINYTVENNDQINSITFALNSDKSIKLYKKDFTYKCNINDITYEIVD